MHKESNNIIKVQAGMSHRGADCDKRRVTWQLVLKARPDVSVAPWWVAAELVINPAVAVLADGMIGKLKTEVHVKYIFLQDGVCHFKVG